MECTAKVFILTGEWADRDGQLTLTYYGRSPKMGAVEIVFTNIKSCFFIPRTAELPELNCKFSRKSFSLKNFHYDELDALYFNSHQEARQCADRLKLAGIPTFENDVKPHERFLMENFINGQMAVQGEAVKKGNLLTFKNPKIQPCEVNTKFRVCSLDIECSVPASEGRLTTQDMARKGVLFSIACHMTGAGADKEICFMLGDKRETRPDNLEIYPSEQAVLNAFMEWFRDEDPDFIIGWHITGFDLMYLEEKCNSFYMDLDISRNGKKPYFNAPQSGGYYATISGRIVLDGPPCMRDAGFTFSNYKLETIAQDLLGEGKIITSSQADKIAEIVNYFENDKDMLSKYNIQDCVLVTRIFEHVNMVEFMTDRVKTSGLLLASISISNVAFEHLYLPRLHRFGFCAPAPSTAPRAANQNDSNCTFTPGVYDNTCVFEIHNLLATLISAFHIDPLAKARSQGETISTPGLVQFSKNEHILPNVFNELKKSSLIKKEETSFNKAAALTLRALIDSLRSPTNRFYSYDINASIDECITWFIDSTRSFLEQEGYILIAGSIHNLYIQMKEQEANSALEHGDVLASRLSKHIATIAQGKFSVDIDLKLKCQKHFTKIVIPDKATFSKENVKDIRYAALINEEVEIIGLKIGGADWTELAADFQNEMYHKFFTTDNIEEWMKEFCAALKAGMYNDKLSYTKKLLKHVDEYTGNIPPHVRAAKMLDQAGKSITYVITSRGPVPTELNPMDLDFQNYMDRQLAPVANCLLSFFGKNFEGLFKAQQLSLFGF
ncbi:MAG: hypothetical protein HRT88_04095 [Lentisphaeraceae bacterium]|nr:hypothetical protein [Lentisphaeraceae bacterium]